MGLAVDMKNLSEELLSSFRQRISENEDLVNEVKKTLDGFHKDHQELAAALSANAAELRKDMANDEKERLLTYKNLMGDIHNSISEIRKEVAGIQTTTFNLINEFATERGQMADELNKFFSDERNERKQNEKDRLKDFDLLMKDINNDISSINNEVLNIFKETNDMIALFEKEHQEMSAELRAELSANLAERVKYTSVLLTGFQKRLAEISKENQKMAQKLRKDLANGEVGRINDYKRIMKGINTSISVIRKEVKGIKDETTFKLNDLLQNRVQASVEWSKMKNEMAKIRNKSVTAKPEKVAVKAEKKEVKLEAQVIEEKKIVVEEKAEPVVKAPAKPKAEPKTKAPASLEEKVLDYINKHPGGVRISEMEEPIGETRMKLGFIAKNLLDEGKVLKIDTVYYPVTKHES